MGLGFFVFFIEYLLYCFFSHACDLIFEVIALDSGTKVHIQKKKTKHWHFLNDSITALQFLLNKILAVSWSGLSILYYIHAHIPFL